MHCVLIRVFTFCKRINWEGKTEQIIELHYQKLDAALNAKLALHNTLVRGEVCVCVWGGLFSSQLTVYRHAAAAENFASLDLVDQFSDTWTGCECYSPAV